MAEFSSTESTLRYFADFLVDQVSYRTVKLYMASIRFFHISIVGLSSKRRLPITMSLLQKLESELAQAPDILPHDKLMLWCAFTLAFFAFLRSSEFTSPSTSHCNALSHHSASDISFNSDGSLSLHLKASKTDTYCQGCSLLIAPSGGSICAVRAIKEYMAHHPFNSDSPFYIFQSGLYLTRAKVTSTLCLLLKILHIPTELYASHSFRIGAATTAAEAGLPPWLIQTLGRWSHNCFALYIRTPCQCCCRNTICLEPSGRTLHSFDIIVLLISFRQHLGFNLDVPIYRVCYCYP